MKNKNIVSKPCVFLKKVERQALAPARERRDPHGPPRMRTTYFRSCRGVLSSTAPAQRSEAFHFCETEFKKKCFQTIELFHLLSS